VVIGARGRFVQCGNPVDDADSRCRGSRRCPPCGAGDRGLPRRRTVIASMAAAMGHGCARLYRRRGELGASAIRCGRPRYAFLGVELEAQLNGEGEGELFSPLPRRQAQSSDPGSGGQRGRVSGPRCSALKN